MSQFISGDSKSGGSKVSLREFFWNYPLYLVRLYLNTRPLSFILLALILNALLVFTLTNPNIFKLFRSAQSNSYNEATVGVITTLNPIFLTQNPVDRDLHEIIYDRLVYARTDGSFAPGLAKSWSVSNDGMKYTFDLDENRYWHDGVPVTASDVAYTINEAKILAKSGIDTIGSVLENVTITVVSDHRFTAEIDEKNAVLLEALAIYIMPEHVLSGVKDQNMFEYGLVVPPIGSGAFKVTQITPNEIDFVKFDKSPTPAKLDKLTYYVFPDLESLKIAYRNNLIDAASQIDSDDLEFLLNDNRFTGKSIVLNQRKKAVFFNLRLDKLKSYELRGGITALIDRQLMIDTAGIDGVPAFSSVSKNNWAFNKDADLYPFGLENAKFMLERDGYKYENGKFYDKDGAPIVLTITYLENDNNEALVNALKTQLAVYGVELKLRPKNYESMTGEILATRDFELLLYEIETSIDPDQYNLWHSSKVDYPNLNFSGYEYGRVDVLFESARASANRDDRRTKYIQAQRLIAFDAPVIFLYEPTFNYVVKSQFKGIDLTGLVYPQDRFINIAQWEK